MTLTWKRRMRGFAESSPRRWNGFAASAVSLELRTPLKSNGLREELEQARRASAIVPRHEAFKAATAQVERGRTVHVKAIGVAERASAAKRQAAERAAIASDAAKECDRIV